MQGGCYYLIVRLLRPVELDIGRLGRCHFPRGWAVYTGSARNGLAARIARHRRADKRLHWHIDYLLAAPDAAIREVIEFPGAMHSECALNRAVARIEGARVPMPGLGASDCREHCPAHLFWFPTRPHPQAHREQ